MPRNLPILIGAAMVAGLGLATGNPFHHDAPAPVYLTTDESTAIIGQENMGPINGINSTGVALKEAKYNSFYRIGDHLVFVKCFGTDCTQLPPDAPTIYVGAMRENKTGAVIGFTMADRYVAQVNGVKVSCTATNFTLNPANIGQLKLVFAEATKHGNKGTFRLNFTGDKNWHAQNGTTWKCNEQK